MAANRGAPPIGQGGFTVSDILGDLDTPPATPTPPASAHRTAAAPPPQQSYGGNGNAGARGDPINLDEFSPLNPTTTAGGGGHFVAEDSLLGALDEEMQRREQQHQQAEDGSDNTVVVRESTVAAEPQAASSPPRHESSFLRDMLGTPPVATTSNNAASSRPQGLTNDASLGRPPAAPDASPAPRAPPAGGMTPAERAAAAVARYNDALVTEDSVGPSVSRQLSMNHRSVSRRLGLSRGGGGSQHHRVLSSSSVGGGLGGSTFRGRLQSSQRMPPAAMGGTPERSASGQASPRDEDFGMSYRTAAGDSEAGAGTVVARTLHSVFSPSWRTPAGAENTISGGFGPTPLARLAAVETSHRRTLELRQAEQLAELAMRMAVAATNVLARVQTIASSDDARRNAARFGGWLENRLAAVDAAVEVKVTLLAEATARRNPIPNVSVTGTSSTPAHAAAAAALPPIALSGAALERHQQRMLVVQDRPGHRRTNSGQVSESSFASGAVGGGSFALEPAAVAGTPRGNQNGPNVPPLSPSAPALAAAGGHAQHGSFSASAATPRGGALGGSRARSHSAARKSGIFASADFASPATGSAVASPVADGPRARSASQAPPKSHERPEAHRKVLAAGRIAADATITTSPPVRVDQVTSEAQRWRAEDFSDYARFSAVQVFLYGQSGSGKTSLAHCLTNKPPTFFKSAPKVDTPTIGISHHLHRLRGLKLPNTPVPLGGFDDQRVVDVKGLMRAAAAAKSTASPACAGVSQLQTSAAMRIVDVPMPLLERWTAPGALPVRGAVHCLVFDLTANPRETRRDLSRIVRHVLASSAAAAFPLPTEVVEGTAGEEETVVAHRPLRVSFVLIGTHRDKLPSSKADDVSMQSALRDEREWLLRHFDELTRKRARAGADGTAASIASAGSPVITAHLMDSYAVSADKWTVVGERPRSAASFPELAEELYTGALLHSPTAPEHIAATILRHCGAAMLREMQKEADAADLSDGSVVDHDDNNNGGAGDDSAAASPQLGGGGASQTTPPAAAAGVSPEARAMAYSAIRSELVRALTVPLQHGNEHAASAAASRDGETLTDKAPLTIEQGFPTLQKAFVAERAALAKEQRARAAAAGTDAPASAMDPSAAAPLATTRSTAAAADDSAAVSLLAASTSINLPMRGATGLVDLTPASLSKVTADAARYLFTALSFGVATLFTSLQRWCDFAGCVLDGVIFQGLVTQHLHLKSAATKLVEVAMAAAAGHDDHGANDPKALANLFGWDPAVVDAIRDDIARDLSRRVCASVLAVGRARGLLCLTDTVPAVNCNAVLLGPLLAHHLVSLVQLPRVLLRDVTGGASNLALAHRHLPAVKALLERATEKELLCVHPDFATSLVRAIQELHDHAELEARVGQSAAAARPPSAAAANMRLVFELFAAGYVNVKLLDQLVRAPLDGLLLPEALQVLLGARITGVTSPIPNAFINKVRLPLAGGVLCTPDRDVLAPSVAGDLAPGLASFIAFAMVTAAEDSDACLTGSLCVSAAPLGLTARFAAAFAHATAPYLVAFRAWRNGFCAELCTVKLSEAQRSSLAATARPGGSAAASSKNAEEASLPEGSRVFQLFVSADDTGATELAAKVCISIAKKRPTPAEHAPVPGSQLCDGDVFDVESVFDQVLLPILDRETHRFGRSTSLLCPDDASVLCSVTSNTDVGYAQRSMPWDAVVAAAREMLVGVPRAAADASLNALRKARDGSTGDRTLRAVLDPVLQYSA